jgi:hypothetical protein
MLNTIVKYKEDNEKCYSVVKDEPKRITISRSGESVGRMA